MTAGLVLQALPDDSFRVVDAAPIVRYMLGWTETKVRKRCIERGWTYAQVGDF